jgi:hypothetical protein
MKVELGDAALGPGGGRKWLAPTEPRWLRKAEQSGGGPCTWMKAKWGRPSSAQSRVEIRTRPRGAVATDGIWSLPHHHTRCHAHVHG